MAGDGVVVPGQHLHRDAGVAQRRERDARGFLRRVEKRDVAKKREAGFVGCRVRCRARRQLLERDRDHAEAVLVQLARDRPQLVLVTPLDRDADAALVRVVAGGEHLVDRALADEVVLRVVGGADDDRHAAPLEIERDLVDLGVPHPRPDVGVKLGVRQHRLVQQVAQSRLEEAVEAGELEHAARLLPEDVHVPLEQHAILRQRAGLVGGEHVHRAEVLDRRAAA